MVITETTKSGQLTTYQKTCAFSNAPIKINPDYEPIQIEARPPSGKVTKYRCVMCGREYACQKGNFLSNNKSPLWKANNGFLPFCKHCCDVMFFNFTKFYNGNEEHALKHMCAIFDWCYSPEASAMTMSTAISEGSRVRVYPAKSNTRQAISKGETYLDTVRNDWEENSKMTASTINVSLDDDGKSDGFEVTDQMIRTWGKGFTPDQYQYLEEEYADWVARNVCNSKTQEEIYRNITLAQLDIRVARQSGGKVSDAQDTLRKLMDSANILPKQTAENLLADTQTFGTLIEKYEKTRPIPEPAKEWQDVDGIRKYINTWVRGGLGKALRVKNDNVALYTEAVNEMNKYTVSRESSDQSADGMGAAMFETDDAAQEDGDSDGERQ